VIQCICDLFIQNLQGLDMLQMYILGHWFQLKII